MKNLEIHIAKYQKFADNCNKDSGYPNSYQAGLERGELEDEWKRKYPELAVPKVEWSQKNGKYEVMYLPDSASGSV